MNGWDFFEKMQERSSLHEVPAIIRSSSPKQAPASAKRVLAKPLRFDQLVSVVRVLRPMSYLRLRSCFGSRSAGVCA
jgi:hypothetical protein